MSHQDDLKENIIIINNRRLRELKELAALLSPPATPSILLEIESLEAESERLLKDWDLLYLHGNEADIILRRPKDLTISLLDNELPHRRLTPHYLANYVSPYLQAIADLQHLIDEIQGHPHTEVQVLSIHQGSAIISLEGASKAIELIMSVIVPWRYKHAQIMAKLDESEKLTQIERTKTEILAKRRQSAKDDKKAEIELTKQQADVAKLELENEKLRLELHRDKIQLAFDVLDKINPDLTEIDKFDYAMRLLKPLEDLVSSDFEPKLIETLAEDDEEAESDESS